MKMNKNEKIFCILGMIFVLVIGTFSHFFYEWSNYNTFLGILFPVNESTWEHLKLTIFPTLIWFFIGITYVDNKNYIVAFFITLVLPMIIIPVLFYSYNLLTVQSILIIDISIFILSVVIAWICCYFVFMCKNPKKIYNVISFIGVFLIILFYFLFTIFLPKIFLFEDPITNHYGIY